ncbi:hypothetical protein BOTBODRAFT_187713 [Botryobasidium botryosum FD-172 SS1]|uniref:Carrier domain-containing protein n=1 Tax=Botryobasidium botryosum (strain FD-172 SS1) TaxID=930990 RepID=A0A067MIW7_BOTB1|nr:hypothetical protein BOTBODRAFT_187713 [Botryobasidium botryosum FD-172 SS1]
MELELVSSAFAQVLGLDPCNIDHDAEFSALGGDSLGAIRLSILLRKAGFPKSAREIFEGSSISSILASASFASPASRLGGSPVPAALTNDRLASEKFKGAADIAPVELEFVLYKHSIPAHHIEDAYYGPTPQRNSLALGFLARAPRPQSIEFDVLMLDVRGDPSAEQVRRAVDVVMQKHTILRAVPALTQSFKIANLVLKPEYCHVQLKFIDSSDGDAEEQDALLEKMMQDERHEGYRLGNITWRLIYARATEKRPAQLVWNVPHGHLDGWSFQLLNNDIAHLLNGEKIKGSDFRPYADYLAAMDSSDNLRWFRQALSPLPLATWPVQDPTKLPIIDTTFYVKWRLNFTTLCSALGVTPFTACLSAMAVTLAQRQGTLITDQPVALGHLSAGRAFELEGIEAMAGPCLNYMVKKLNPRADKTGRDLLAETQSRVRGDFARDHCIQKHWDEIFDQRDLLLAARTLVSVNFQNLPAMSAGDKAKYSITRGLENMPAICSLGLEIYPGVPDSEGNEEWKVMATFDSTLVSKRDAVAFADDTFVHMRRLLTRSEERLSAVVVKSPGQSGDDLHVPTSVDEVRYYTYPLVPAYPFSGILRMLIGLFTVFMFNVRQALMGKLQIKKL